MKTATVKIKGVAPMLMNRFVIKDPLAVGSGAEVSKTQYDPKEDAEKALHKNGKGCFVPSTWIEATLRESAKDFKLKGKGKKTYKDVILSAVWVEPVEILMGKDTYDEIDSRAAVIQRNRIVKSRPRFNKWELSFVIKFNENHISSGTVKQILVNAGETRGIGDYRPKFGRFEVTEFKNGQS